MRDVRGCSASPLSTSFSFSLRSRRKASDAAAWGKIMRIGKTPGPCRSDTKIGIKCHQHNLRIAPQKHGWGLNRSCSHPLLVELGGNFELNEGLRSFYVLVSLLWCFPSTKRGISFRREIAKGGSLFGSARVQPAPTFTQTWPPSFFGTSGCSSRL